MPASPPSAPAFPASPAANAAENSAEPSANRSAETSAEIAAWNASLNRTHDMAALRARGGGVVKAVEERRRRLVASRVLRARPGVVADVGCEDGWIAEAYAASATETILVDCDPAMLARADARGLPRARTLVGEATDPRCLPRASVDVLVLSAVLEHLPRPADALQALCPAVKDGGRVVAYVPADGPILFAKGILKRTGLSRLAKGVSLEPAPGHLHTFDRASFSALLRPFGALLELTFDPGTLGYVGVLRVASGRA
jgi:SAM-dependent methyltransferase